MSVAKKFIICILIPIISLICFDLIYKNIERQEEIRQKEQSRKTEEKETLDEKIYQEKEQSRKTEEKETLDEKIYQLGIKNYKDENYDSAIDAFQYNKNYKNSKNLLYEVVGMKYYSEWVIS